MQDFGSPNAGDATARREKRIIEAVRRRQKRLDLGSGIINRPIGSKVDISDEDQIADWRMLEQDPERLVKKVGQRALAIGPEKAELEMRRWDKEMAELEEGTA